MVLYLFENTYVFCIPMKNIHGIYVQYMWIKIINIIISKRFSALLNTCPSEKRTLLWLVSKNDLFQKYLMQFLWRGKISSGNISMQSSEQKVFVVNTILLGYLRLISRLYTNTPPTLFLKVNSISKFLQGKHTDPWPALSEPTWGARAGLKVH